MDEQAVVQEYRKRYFDMLKDFEQELDTLVDQLFVKQECHVYTRFRRGELSYDEYVNAKAQFRTELRRQITSQI